MVQVYRGRWIGVIPLSVLYSDLWKQLISVFQQCEQQDHSENAAGNHFTRCDGHERKPQRPDAVAVQQHQRHNDGIGHDGRDRREPFAASLKQISTKGAEKRGNRSENDVGQCAAGQNIGEKTADIKSGDGGRGKKWQDGERFGKAHLNVAVRETQRVREVGEHNIKSGDDGRMCQEQNVP